MTTRMPFLLTIVVAALATFGATAAQAGAPKVNVCHIPPGNPENFHTIRISENALAAHLAHGDLPDSCNALCAELCDDGDACTVDDSGDCEQEGCPVVPEPVNCDDGLNCTIDSCVSATGCIYESVVCTPPDLCHTSACAEPEGACFDSPLSCDAGEECNPVNGMCESTGPGVECAGVNWLAVGAAGLNWSAAEAECVALSGHLASIHSVEEHNCARELLIAAGAPDVGGWIGFIEQTSEGNFVWSDGSPVDYTNWRSGEPSNDSGAVFDCAHIWLYPGDGFWNDIGCNRTDASYICRF